MRAALDSGLRAGVAFIPMHWTDQFSSSGPVGRLVHAAVDPVSGQPDLKGTGVRMRALTERWRGQMFRRAGGSPELGSDVYWSRTAIASGHSFELAGWTALESVVDSEAVLRHLLGIPREAELVSFSDPRKAVFRYAGVANGRLEGCVFFGAPDTDLSACARAERLLGRDISPIERLSLLAGSQAGVSRSAGKIVCSCFAVDDETIRSAILERKLRNTSEIGAVLRAGTNCGSCIPELKKLLGANALTMAV